jgi:hypothetical protein
MQFTRKITIELFAAMKLLTNWSIETHKAEPRLRAQAVFLWLEALDAMRCNAMQMRSDGIAPFAKVTPSECTISLYHN